MDILLRILLSVDHISYKQEAAMNNRAHIFSVNNIYLILWCSRYWPIDFKSPLHRTYLMDVSHQQQTTMLRVLLVLSRCIHLSWHSSSSIAWRNGYQNWSLCRHLYSKEMCSDYWVASNIVDSHMTLAKYCYHYLKDKLVICSFIGPSFHQAIISHALWCHQSLSLQLSMANPIELEDEDQHLNLGGCLRSKQAISIL